MTAGTLGWIMLAPAATAYAVLPVGVDTINPSPYSRDMSLYSIDSVNMYYAQSNLLFYSSFHKINT